MNVAKSFKACAWIDGAAAETESVLLHDISNILQHKALSAPSIHARALKDFTTSILSFILRIWKKSKPSNCT